VSSSSSSRECWHQPSDMHVQLPRPLSLERTYPYCTQYTVKSPEPISRVTQPLTPSQFVGRMVRRLALISDPVNNAVKVSTCNNLPDNNKIILVTKTNKVFRLPCEVQTWMHLSHTLYVVSAGCWNKHFELHTFTCNTRATGSNPTQQ
jgi:hypothetical protein